MYLIFSSNVLGVCVLGRLKGRLLSKDGLNFLLDENKLFLHGSKVEEDKKIFLLISLKVFREILDGSTPKIEPYLKLSFKKKLIFLKLYSYISIFFLLILFLLEVNISYL